MNNNLVPEYRHDVTGKLVKRWVKPDQGAANSISMPAPSSPQQAEEADMQWRRGVVGTKLARERMYEQGEITDYLREASDDLINFIHDTVTSDHDETVPSAEEFAVMAFLETDEQTVYEYATLQHVHGDAMDDTSATLSLIQGLHMSNANRNWMDISDSVSIEQNANLLRVAMAVMVHEDEDFNNKYLTYDMGEYTGSSSIGFTDDKVVELIMNNPDRMDTLLDLIEERGGSSFDVFDELVKEGHSPLNEGRL